MKEFNYLVFEHFPVIETARLLLKNMVAEDAQKILEFRKNDRIREFIHRKRMDDLENVNDLIERITKGYEDKAMMAWEGVIKSTNTFIGSCGFNKIDIPKFKGRNRRRT
ncbi:MAG: GNAT family N-acetyltransferase [bacterium]|nr:GNAT family N-acetyltransferase [bacterium]